MFNPENYSGRDEQPSWRILYYQRRKVPAFEIDKKFHNSMNTMPEIENIKGFELKKKMNDYKWIYRTWKFLVCSRKNW